MGLENLKLLVEEIIGKMDLVAATLADSLDELDTLMNQSLDTLGAIILEEERRNTNEKH